MNFHTEVHTCVTQVLTLCGYIQDSRHAMLHFWPSCFPVQYKNGLEIRVGYLKKQLIFTQTHMVTMRQAEANRA